MACVALSKRTFQALPAMAYRLPPVWRLRRLAKLTDDAWEWPCPDVGDASAGSRANKEFEDGRGRMVPANFLFGDDPPGGDGKRDAVSEGLSPQATSHRRASYVQVAS